MEQKTYKDSLNLPKTDFPMRANLPVREQEILKEWQNLKTYEALKKQSEGNESFYLHDGPPFANGDIHLGHVLNKVLKDIVIRHKTMNGYEVPYIPGWDCHGLPIEHQVVKKLKNSEKEPVTIRRKCSEYADEFIEKQREQFKRLGIWGEWEKPYLTKDATYEAEQLRLFAELVEKDLVYEGLRPVYWSTGCRTALAEAEVEYQDRTDDSIYVRFPLTDASKAVAGCSSGDKVSLLVWTTTPWTLPANMAVAFNAVQVEYALYHDESGGEWVIAAKSLAEKVSAVSDITMTLKKDLAASDLERLEYRHPFISRNGKLFEGSFVTDDTGTGLVHIAPGHGHDDYSLGLKNGLDLLSPVDEGGRFTDACGVEALTGKYVLDANKDVIEILKSAGLLAAHEPYTHSYPHCWRSKTPIIFRSVKQWFIRVEGFKKKAMDNIEQVQWFPKWGKNRIQGSVEARQDWCISRQRTWGVPIPVFYSEQDGAPLLSSDVIRKFAALADREGAGVWFSMLEDDLKKALGVPVTFKKGMDTLDVWIDSGSSFRAVSRKRLNYPADLYLEGSDQHRGWFQSSLLLSSAVESVPPFKAVLTHGFVVDGDGKKMSKSVGNVVKPQEIMQTYGADILRLWVVSSDFSDDIRVSQDIFGRIADAYRKFRNTIRYALGNMHGYDPARQIDLKDMPAIDRWILSRLSVLTAESRKYFDQYEYHRFYQAIYKFCTNELSSVYFDILKDRLYTDHCDSVSGQSARHTLFQITVTLLKLLAPVMPFTTEEAWGFVPDFKGKKPSVHLELWPARNEDAVYHDADLEAKMSVILKIRSVILGELELCREKKEIGNSLEAEVELHVFEDALYDSLSKDRELIELICLVSRLNILRDNSQSGSEVTAKAARSESKKCERCWKRTPEVGKSEEFDDLCKRCIEVLKGHACRN